MDKIVRGLKSAMANRRRFRALEEPPAILVMLKNAETEQKLRSAIQPLGWRMTAADSVASGMARLEQDPFSLVIVDRSLLAGDWRAAVSRISKSHNRPMVFLLSEQIDQNLWEEVTRSGGYDVLCVPVQPAALAASLARAWSLWRNMDQLRRLTQ